MAQAKAKSESTFDVMPQIEVPAAVREIAEKGVAQAKDAYAKLKEQESQQDQQSAVDQVDKDAPARDSPPPTPPADSDEV